MTIPVPNPKVVEIVVIKESPSGSVSFIWTSTILIGASSRINKVSSKAIGASFTGVIVRKTIAVSQLAKVSHT